MYYCPICETNWFLTENHEALRTIGPGHDQNTHKVCSSCERKVMTYTQPLTERIEILEQQMKDFIQLHLDEIKQEKDRRSIDKKIAISLYTGPSITDNEKCTCGHSLHFHPLISCTMIGCSCEVFKLAK